MRRDLQAATAELGKLRAEQSAERAKQGKVRQSQAAKAKADVAAKAAKADAAAAARELAKATAALAKAEAAHTSKLAAAQKIHSHYFELFRALFIESNPGPVKASLAMLGQIQEDYRLPMVRLAGENRIRLRKVLGQCGVLKSGRKSGS